MYMVVVQKAEKCNVDLGMAAKVCNKVITKDGIAVVE